jgi:hypothetical protein
VKHRVYELEVFSKCLLLFGLIPSVILWLAVVLDTRLRPFGKVGLVAVGDWQRLWTSGGVKSAVVSSQQCRVGGVGGANSAVASTRRRLSAAVVLFFLFIHTRMKPI